MSMEHLSTTVKFKIGDLELVRERDHTIKESRWSLETSNGLVEIDNDDMELLCRHVLSMMDETSHD